MGPRSALFAQLMGGPTHDVWALPSSGIGPAARWSVARGRGVAAAQPAGYSVFQLVSPEVRDAKFFGRSVASLGPDLVIGAPGWVADGTRPGRVYVMSPMGNVRLTIENPTPAGGDEFGAAVAVVGANILVGAPFDDTAGDVLIGSNGS